MSDPTDIISIVDTLAILGAVPDIVASDGDVSVRNRAISWINTRAGASWRCQFPRESLVTLPSGKVVAEPLPTFDFRPEQIASQYVIIDLADGRSFRFPAILVQALGAWAYVAMERGALVPDVEPET